MKKLYALLVLSLFIGTYLAQILTTYTSDDGLAHNSTNCVDVDANNDVWFGTLEGLSLFDGTTWTTFNTTNSDLIADNVLAILVAEDERIWAGTDFGISVFDGTTWTNYTEDDGIEDEQIRHIAEDPGGNIWFGTGSGVSMFDGTNWTNLGFTQGLPFGGVNHIIYDPTGVMLFSTGLSGMYIFDGASLEAVTETEGLQSNFLRSIAVDNVGNRWIGSAEGITVMDQNNLFINNYTTLFELPPPDTLNPITDMVIDDLGNVWANVYVEYLVTEGGVSVYDGSEWSQFDTEDGLAGPVVRRIASDLENNIWVCTSTGVTKITDFASSIKETENSTLAIYPNPSSSVINIQNEKGLELVIELYSQIGAKLIFLKSIENGIEVDLHTLSPGIYHLVLSTEKGFRQQSKIMVQ